MERGAGGFRKVELPVDRQAAQILITVFIKIT
jgi:hypothetical protein